MDLSNVPLEDLRPRFETVLNSLDSLFKKIGPDLKEIGNLRIEAKLIYSELVKRGVPVTNASEQREVSET